MAIPGSKPKYEVHAKVKIGIKGERFPKSVDYFLSPAPEFAEVAGERPSTIRIRLIHDSVDEAFSTGLEWWKGKLLACYTKGEGDPPQALRVASMKVKDATLNLLDADDVRLGPDRGQGRAPIVCRARECPHFGSDCKPMGRLLFVLDADPVGRVYELDTKGWNSIEALEGALKIAGSKGPLTGRLFDLSVRFESRGQDRFPVLSISEVAVPLEVNDDKDVAVAEALVKLGNSERTREDLAAYLDVAMPGWRQKEKVVARIKEIGVEQSIANLMRNAA